jgi:hypothetical protein
MYLGSNAALKNAQTPCKRVVEPPKLSRLTDLFEVRVRFVAIPSFDRPFRLQGRSNFPPFVRPCLATSWMTTGLSRDLARSYGQPDDDPVPSQFPFFRSCWRTRFPQSLTSA